MEERKSYLTTEFYENPKLLVNVFNELYAIKNCVSDFDMYESGEFLFYEVYDTPETREKLSVLISNFDEYKKALNSNFIGGCDEKHIDLSELEYQFTEAFGFGKKRQWIYWDKNNEKFVLKK
jgi:hypothetical protein